MRYEESAMWARVNEEQLREALVELRSWDPELAWSRPFTRRSSRALLSAITASYGARINHLDASRRAAEVGAEAAARHHEDEARALESVQLELEKGAIDGLAGGRR